MMMMIENECRPLCLCVIWVDLGRGRLKLSARAVWEHSWGTRQPTRWLCSLSGTHTCFEVCTSCLLTSRYTCASNAWTCPKPGAQEALCLKQVPQACELTKPSWRFHLLWDTHAHSLLRDTMPHMCCWHATSPPLPGPDGHSKKKIWCTAHWALTKFTKIIKVNLLYEKQLRNLL